MKNNYKTLVLGLEHFIDKIGYQALAYQYYNHPVTYLTSDASGFSLAFSKKYNAEVVIVPLNIINRIIFTIKYLLRKEYTHVEIYYTGRLVYLYMVFCKIFRKKTLFILRGFEFDKKHGRFWDSLVIKSIKLSDKILAKEPFLFEEAKKIVSIDKLLFLPNSIEAYSGKILDYDDRDIDILFLNTPRKERNLFLLINALEILLAENSRLRITIAGFSVFSEVSNKIQPEYQNDVLNYIRQKKLENILTTKPFINNPYDLHSHAKIFVLPANFIFLNYSMLESMSCGTVPVVTKGEGWEKIITEENGFVSDFDAESLAGELRKALNKDKWEQKSYHARETVLKHYDIIQWGEKILKFKEIII
ncbi:MAG: glycosyltransferase [Bacteroidales bacterium]|jgi:glycosyltransferase involved in cell wall biosynthesis|nr:glycosyltransferase [Bacteroidales bacterium]